MTLARTVRRGPKSADTRDQTSQFLSMIPAIVYTQGPDGNDPLRFLNNKIKEILGYEPSEFESDQHAWLRLLHPEDRQRFEVERYEVVKNGQHTFEHRFRHKDGRYRWIRRHQMLARDKTGNPERIIGVGFDITDLKQAEVRLTNFMNAAPDAVITVSETGRIVRVNLQAEIQFGYSATEMIGRHVNMLVPHAQREAHSRHYTSYAKNPVNRPMAVRNELSALRKDGRTFPVDINLSTLETEGDELFVCTIHDISRRREIQAQLQQAQKMEAVGQLTSGVAHDFNNLLTIIIGNLQVLEEPSSVRVRAALDAAQRGAELTHRLLAFSRQSAESQVTSINELVIELEPMLQTVLGREFTVEIKLDSRLWLTKIDPSQLINALLNLAFNARDAMPAEGKLVVTTTNLAVSETATRAHGDLPHGEYVLLSVSDNGAGISKDALPHVFEPFFSTKAPGKGSGLGLSTVYGFIKRFQGEIRIRSTPGNGTTIELYLPRTLCHAEQRERLGTADGSSVEGHETILLVESDDAVREITGTHLRNLGYVALPVATGPEALIALDQHDDIDLLLTDVLMPGGMSGADLARYARQNNSKFNVLYTTGNMRPSASESAVLRLDDDILSKPYGKRELGMKLRSVLDRK